MTNNDTINRANAAYGFPYQIGHWYDTRSVAQLNWSNVFEIQIPAGLVMVVMYCGAQCTGLTCTNRVGAAASDRGSSIGYRYVCCTGFTASAPYIIPQVYTDSGSGTVSVSSEIIAIMIRP